MLVMFFLFVFLMFISINRCCSTFRETPWPTLCVCLTQPQIHNSGSTGYMFYSFANVYVHCRHLGLWSLGWWGCSNTRRGKSIFSSSLKFQLRTWKLGLKSNGFAVISLWSRDAGWFQAMKGLFVLHTLPSLCIEISMMRRELSPDWTRRGNWCSGLNVITWWASSVLSSFIPCCLFIKHLLLSSPVLVRDKLLTHKHTRSCF